jgi:tRNA A37 methylthiotransferase MiaB
MLTSLQPLDFVEPNDQGVPTTKKLKILVYHANPKDWPKAWLYPLVLQLKMQIDLFCPEIKDQLEWSIPIQQEISDEELIKQIEQTGVDILCTSHYIWNHDYLCEQLSRIKSKSKNDFKIIAGGASIDVNINKEFFKHHPYIDYAVYGPGEVAFADIITHLTTKKPLIAFNTSNCAWQNHKTGKTVIADYKVVKMIETSPYIHNKDMFIVMATHIKKQAKLAGKEVWIPYTTTRGCPYSCTFCDWNGGLGTKVSRRKNTYQQEIDLFEELSLTNMYLSDANVGLYNEDVDMIEYFAEKNIKKNSKFLIQGNYSKLNKNNNLKIYHALARGRLITRTLNFSLQDLNQQVLKNIDRPDIGWDEHVKIADELKTAHPHLVIKAQIIYGLPGQTPQTWKQTLFQMIEKNILPIIFLNEPLASSPALYDSSYQDKFQFEYIESTRMDWGGRHYLSLIPKKCISFTQFELVEMQVTSVFLHALSVINLRLNLEHEELELIVESLLKSENYRRLCNNLYHNWTVDNNFYYTISFLGQPTVPIPADAHGGAAAIFASDPDAKEFLLQVVKLCKGKSIKSIKEISQNYPEFFHWAKTISLEFM